MTLYLPVQPQKNQTHLSSPSPLLPLHCGFLQEALPHFPLLFLPHLIPYHHPADPCPATYPATCPAKSRRSWKPRRSGSLCLHLLPLASCFLPRHHLPQPSPPSKP